MLTEKRTLLAVIQTWLLFGMLAMVVPVQASQQGSSSQERKYTVAFAQDTMSNDWRAAQVRAVEAELAKYPYVKFIHTDAEGSSSRQALDIEKLVAAGADVIITSPRDANTLTPVISRFYESGVPIILLTRRTNNDKYTTFISANDYEIGRQAADYVASRLNKKGKVVMLKGVATATTSIHRTEGFVEQLKKYPEISIVAEAHADYRRNTAITVMEKILADGVEFDALYAQSDSMATGARLVMKAAGLDLSNKIIVGIDNIEEARQAIMNGEQDATFTYPNAGKQGAEAAIKIIQGQKIQKDQRIPFALVTKQDLK